MKSFQSQKHEAAMTLQALVPLITYPDTAAGQVGQLAVHTASHLGADIHALSLEPSFRPPTNMLTGLVIDVPGMVRDIRNACQVRGTSLTQAIADLAAPAGVGFRSGRIERIPESFGDVIADQARYHDLTLFGWNGEDAARRSVIEAVIFGSGRPVVLLPERVELPNYGTIVIAWDGSAVAARAVADAEHFLAKALKVIVATVTDEKPLEEDKLAERLAEHLGRRGIPAEARGIVGHSRPIARTLQDEALAANAGLLVMGAYGHSRLRDFVLGGATKGILTDLRVPTLLSH
ncbi:universal stress protein [Devosia sp. A449]